MRHKRALTIAAAMIAVGLSVPAGAIETQTLLEADHTIVGEPIVYPSGSAKVTAVIATFAPGESTDWHTHGIPVFGHVLEGELTVDYGPQGKHVYRAGDSVMEAISIAHKGTNTGSGPMRLLVVFMGAEGKPNSVPASKPQ